MSLQKRIDEDLKDAMRAKDAARLSVLRLLKAALKNATIEKVGADGELNDSKMLTAIIVAAGSSKRVGFDKLFSKLGDRSVLEHALAAFEEAESVSEIIVVCRDPKLVQDAINRAGGRKVRAVVRGGERRRD